MNQDRESRLAPVAPLAPEQAQIIQATIQQIMGPFVEAVAKVLENNTNALNQLAEAQQMQADRMGALEKQIRLNTPVTPQQVRYFNDAIRARARELLDKREIDDPKATRKMAGMIRKSVLSKRGVGTLNEIPRHEYDMMMGLIGMWNDMLCVRDVVKEARARNDVLNKVSETASAEHASPPVP